jgi:hypothetical protein
LTNAETLIQEGFTPARYLERLWEQEGYKPYAWEIEALDPGVRRLIILSCRQAGKSTITAVKTLNKAKTLAGALNLVTAPTQDQSKELVKKMDMFRHRDPRLPALTHDGTFEKEFVNGSRIVALPGSERSVRGYTGPKTIIIDEASQVSEDLVMAIRPMMIGADTELILLSTPRGKRGYFYRQWTQGRHWKKILVRIGFDLVDGKLVKAMPEKQFHELMLKQGVLAYYSPRHTLEELEEELQAMDEVWFRQEYLCEFVDTMVTYFPLELTQAAMDDTVEPLFRSALDDSVEPLEVVR